MRNIDEIIKELQEHPDYCFGEIHTWSHVLEVINEDLDGEKEITLEDLDENQKIEIEDNIAYMLCDNYNYSSIIPENIIDSLK